MAALTVASMGLVLAVDSEPTIDKDEALPSRRGTALIGVTPPMSPHATRVALRVETPSVDGSVVYGSRYDIEQRTPSGWTWRYAGSIQSGEILQSRDSGQLVVARNGDIKEVSGSGPVVLWNANGIFGATEVRVDVSGFDAGSYRFRIGFVERQPSGAHEAFSLAAPFTVNNP